MSDRLTTSEWVTTTAGPEETEAHGARAADLLSVNGAVLVFGPLGAGKTTWVRGVLRRLGVTGRVKSPTFDLVHPYQAGVRAIVHVDLYRLDPAPDPEELGVDPTGSLVLVEWGEPWRGLWPDHVEVALTPVDAATRRIAVRGCGRWAERLTRWRMGQGAQK